MESSGRVYNKKKGESIETNSSLDTQYLKKEERLLEDKKAEIKKLRTNTMETESRFEAIVPIVNKKMSNSGLESESESESEFDFKFGGNKSDSDSELQFVFD